MPARVGARLNGVLISGCVNDDRPVDHPEKSHLLTQAIALAERSSGTGGPPKDEVGPLLHAYYRHVATDDLRDRSAEELYGALVSHYRTADVAPQGTASVHVFTPTLAEHGWSAGGHSVVEVVTDDMPFLVDSVVMELTRQQRDVHLVVHPQFDVTRDVTGRLSTIACPDNESAAPPEGAERESWMHVEISRIGHDEDVDAIAADLQRVLRDVRESVEDWDRMRQQVDVIVASCGPTRRPRSRPRSSSAASPSSSGWPTTTSRSSATASTTSSARVTTSSSAAFPAPVSASCATTPTSPLSASCPRRSPRWPASAPCWCWPRPTPAPPCTVRRTSTTSG